MLDQLIQWVREFETRDDEYGLKRHRNLFDNFTGPKKEYTTVQKPGQPVAELGTRLNSKHEGLLPKSWSSLFYSVVPLSHPSRAPRDPIRVC
jgi:hypothetical protein